MPGSSYGHGRGPRRRPRLRPSRSRSRRRRRVAWNDKGNRHPELLAASAHSQHGPEPVNSWEPRRPRSCTRRFRTTDA